MVNNRKDREEPCWRFREELELIHVAGDAVIERGELLAELRAEVRGHAGECESCLQALDDVVETRNMLLSLAGETSAIEPGPWFSSKVIKVIAARERESEARDGFWASVQKLAPRLAAVCALLLVLVGTWAMQTQRAYQARQMAAPAESLFDTGSAGPQNDDVMTNPEAHR
jgi:hypothetical protein